MRSLPVVITALGLAVAAGCTRTTRTVLVVPEARSEGGPSTAATRGVPPGHQPRPKSRSCEGIEADAPAGSWILYRPTADRKIVHARMVDERRAGVVVRIRVFEVESGRFVREENP